MTTLTGPWQDFNDTGIELAKTLARDLAYLEADIKPIIDATYDFDLADPLSWPAASGPSYSLVIDYNSVAVNDPCPICGTRTDSDIGPELMLDSSRSPVCYDCGLKYAPELVRLLRQGQLCDAMLHEAQLL